MKSRMTQALSTGTALSIATLLFLAAAPADAASLMQVSGWGGAGLPSDVSMYVYLPSKMVANPPILTLIHYCGGTASSVFGQAQGGGIVSAADQYGFIMVVPSSGRCWDVESNKAWTRSGGGDSDAIKQMVTYAIGKYSANKDRVYSTGDSSGAMMTELLLALYPDIFKAGSAFAGMPAGCRGSSESTGAMGYSGACAGGSVTHTAQQWGDIVRNMDPGYTGHRPRVQLFHGSADTTISPTNMQQATLEWTNILGLNATPSAMMTGVQLGMHQATRQQWQSSCGYLVLDTFLSMGGDHGPSDALFLSQYVIPFLGLDKTGAVDPEVAQCGDGGGAAGAAGTGGAGMGGQSGGGHPGTGGTASGGSGTGGGGGLTAVGGRPGSGGSVGSGGLQGGGSGGAAETGGSSGTATGGASGQTGITGSGGHSAGGSTGSGGVTGSGGSGSGGVKGSGGAGAQEEIDPGSAGCNCALAPAEATDPRWAGLVVLALSLGLRARRRSRQTR